MWEGPPLDESFFGREADVVARELVGTLLLHDTGVRRLAVRLVETEAYLDGRDLASHARFGQTRRNAAMFGPPGRAYVYFVYGMHTMLNVVTGPPGRPQAVLLRAAEPVMGDLAPMNGPALLTRALGVQLSHNGVDLMRGPLRVVRGTPAPRIECGPRIGVGYAGAWSSAPLRFVDADSLVLSRKLPGRARGDGIGAA